MKDLLKGLLLFSLIFIPSLVFAETKVYFSPNGGCQEAIVTELKRARKTIDIAMYSLSSREISRVLVEAKGRHIKIRISLDIAQIKDSYSKCKFLVSKGLNVKFHMGPGLMHDKFAVIDERVVLTGSYNWTATAEKKNCENLLVIRDRDLAWKYTKQFKHIWSQSGQGQLKVLRPEEIE